MGARTYLAKCAGCAGLTIMLSAAAGQAKGPERPVLVEVLSFGKDSCGQFLEASPTSVEMYLSWTTGYISGQNGSATTPKWRLVGQSWDRDSMLLWLRQYCSAHPLDMYVAASAAFRNSLAEKEGIQR